MSLFRWSFEHPTPFQWIILVLSFWPLFLLFLLPSLYPVVLSTVLFLLIIRFSPVMFDLRSKFQQAPIHLKYRTTLFVISATLTLWFLVQLLNFSFTPLVLTFLNLVILYSWSNRMLTKSFDTVYPFVPTFKVDYESNPFDTATLGIYAVLTSSFSVIYLLISSFLKSRGQEVLLLSEIRIFLLIPLLLVHVVLHQIYNHQYSWVPEDGKIELQGNSITKDIPAIDNPGKLSQYLYELSFQTHVEKEVMEYLSNNLGFFGRKVRQIEYSGVLMYLVHLFSTCGRQTKEYAHLLVVLVNSSLKNYRVMSHIPITRRYVLYYYLAWLYQIELVDKELYDHIQFEISNNKDQFQVISWIVDQTDPFIDPSWILASEGIIYKGKQGYTTLQQEAEYRFTPITYQNQWKKDIFSLNRNFLPYFIGKDSRKVLSSRQFAIDILDTLIEGKTIDEFYQRNVEQEDSSQRWVGTTSTNTEKSKKIGKEQFDRYLSGGDLSEETSVSIVGELLYLLQRLKHNLSNLQYSQVITVVGMIILAVGNILVLRLLQPLLGENLTVLIIALEILIAQFLSISTKQNAVTIDRQLKNQMDIAVEERYSQFSLTSKNPLDVTAAYALLYSLMLIIFANLFVFNYS